tara:strand:+ start:2555 stop:2863 length:309 start_codon:yes stop_codon:yes gene_type:complete
MNFFESQNPSKTEKSFMELADRLWIKEETKYSENYNATIDKIHNTQAENLEESIYKYLRLMEIEITLVPYKMWLNSYQDTVPIDEHLIRKKRMICYYLSFVE